MAEPVKPGVAEVKVVKALAKDMPDEFLQCRDLRHNWRPATARVIPPGERKKRHGAYYERIIRCSLCDCERRQYLSKLGTQLSDYVKYPDGYLLPRGTGRITGSARDVLRVAAIVRLIDSTQAG